jgi:hypothetical protein
MFETCECGLCNDCKVAILQTKNDALRSCLRDLEKQIEELKEAQRWRKMTEEMPIFPDKNDMIVRKRVVYTEGIVTGTVYWNLTGPLPKGNKEE